jgi:hypothetical protein
MKFIATKTHGYLDYLVGALLIAAPWLFNFYEGGSESWVPIILGSGTIVYSLITDYELGLVNVIPMRIHLMVDLVAGIFLAASPWLFGFSDIIIWPHLVVGIMEILVSLMTDPNTRYAPVGKSSDFAHKK